MQTWTFVRHGESVANAQGTLCGLVNSPLSAQGQAQALQVAPALPAELGLCLCSDLLRAVQTAELLTQGRVGIEQHPQLRERNMGEWAGRDKAALRASGAFSRMRTWTGAPEGGESYQTLHQRLLPFLAKVPTRGHSHVLLVAHGGVIRVLLAQVDQLLAQVTGLQSVPNSVPISRQIPADFWAQATAQMES
ncbi:MAG: broad specificity phosphatase PhoE [Cognaticolwellia sp.]